MSSSRFVPLLLLLSLAACDDEDPPITLPNINIVINNTAGGGTPIDPTATPAAPGTCSSITQVNVNGPTVAQVGVPSDLDATPKPARSDNCNNASPISWAASPPAICQVTGPVSTYNPNLTCHIAGSCLVTVVVQDLAGSGAHVQGALVVSCVP